MDRQTDLLNSSILGKARVEGEEQQGRIYDILYHESTEKRTPIDRRTDGRRDRWTDRQTDRHTILMSGFVGINTVHSVKDR